jgi:hypothetical protein
VPGAGGPPGAGRGARIAVAGIGFGSPVGTALSTKMRSPQTTGVELPLPGIATFQRTFLVSLHSTGGAAVGATPVMSGPRHCGQKLSALPSAALAAAANDSDVSTLVTSATNRRFRKVGSSREKRLARSN